MLFQQKAGAGSLFVPKNNSPLIIPVAKAIAQGFWRAEFRDPSGKIIKVDEWENAVVNQGLDYLLTAGLDGGAQITSWFIGLTDGTPTIAGADTLASHAGWSEIAPGGGAGGYTETTRQSFVGGTVSGQSLDNVGNEAVFTIVSNSTTVGGAFLGSVATGTAGTLYAAGAFSGGDVVLSAGSTVTVTATFTMSAS